MEWTRGHTLGLGSTATVSIAQYRRSGDVFAVKSSELCCSESLKREQGILSALNCPQIVAYKGFDVTLENDALLYNVFMEYAPHGTLADAARRHKDGMREPLVAHFTRQILNGLHYLHSKGIVHCDVKGQNILVTEQGAKIADFGCARRVAVADSHDGVIAGTPAFMAPEVARGEQQGFPADVWALGCTVLEMITGEAPWHGVNDPVTALYRIGFSGGVPEIPSYVSEEGRDFLGKCLKRDPRERWTVGELLGHGFVGAPSSDSVLLLEEVELGTSDSVTPTSVLERGFWESVETEKEQRAARECCSWNCGPRDRIRGLCRDQDTMLFASEWECDHGWINVRMTSNEFGTVCISREENCLPLFDELKISMRIGIGISSRCSAYICFCYFTTYGNVPTFDSRHAFIPKTKNSLLMQQLFNLK